MSATHTLTSQSASTTLRHPQPPTPASLAEWIAQAEAANPQLRSLQAQYLDRWHGNLVGAFREFQDRGQIEIITCAATHGFLPLMANHAGAVRAQIRVAYADYERHFGRRPRGIWLPECAYFSGLDRELAAAELRWFVLDAHGVLLGHPRPRAAMYAPGITPSQLLYSARRVPTPAN